MCTSNVAISNRISITSRAAFRFTSCEGAVVGGEGIMSVLTREQPENCENNCVYA